ncbi:MAG: thiamine pyrophosphate-dependent dehydrogenase E1 component subunit alpha, partial [Alphaproteobacteria bacterium]
IRMTEERIAEIYPSDRIQSPVHLSIGQEAAAVGLCSHLRATDLLFTTYRGHAYYLAKGGDMKTMIAELYGRATGFAKGKAGSMHLAAPEVGMMGSSAIVASTIPHAVGAALKSRWPQAGRLGDDITVCVFGDGATEEGVYHESLNFAAVHALPVLFLCENNGLAIHATLADRQSYDLVAHASVYGIEAHRLDTAYDPSAVYNQLGPIIAAMRADRQPRFVELPLFRAREHVGPGEDFHRGYRSQFELTEWRLMDPLLEDDDALADARAGIAAEIDAAFAFAEASPAPDVREVFTDVDRCFG